MISVVKSIDDVSVMTALLDRITSYPPGLIPCRRMGSELWFSNLAADQRRAAAWCNGGCPLVGECREVARRVRVAYGVWGGETAGARRRAGYAPGS
jgi:hypothetical protein